MSHNKIVLFIQFKKLRFLPRDKKFHFEMKIKKRKKKQEARFVRLNCDI